MAGHDWNIINNANNNGSDKGVVVGGWGACVEGRHGAVSAGKCWCVSAVIVFVCFFR